MKHFFTKTLIVASAVIPTISFAAIPVGFDGLKNLIDSLATGVVQSTGYMLLTLAVVAFFWGVVQFIWNSRQGSDGKGFQKGKQFMVWGLIGIFVMFSVWGIIQFAQGVLGIQGYNTITVPSLNFRQGGGAPGSQISGGAFGAGSSPAYNQTQVTAAQTYASCINGGQNTATCEQRYQQAGGTGGAYAAQQTNAQQTYNSCIGNGGTQASCQQQFQQAGGQGSGAQNLASQAYNTCIGNGNSADQCQAAYQAYGGQGSGQQNLAQQAYNTCIGNGNTASECQAAYAAYNGTGSGAQNLAQDAYNTCLSNGNSASECQAAYTAYGGTGDPATQANSNGQCPTGYVPDDSAASGCSQSSSNAVSADTQNSINGQINDGFNSYLDNQRTNATLDQYNQNNIDYGGNQDWQTTGNGFDNADTGVQTGGLEVTPGGDINYDCGTDYCG